jgi:glycosyltransferase involved in cell wall biosynthesis
MNAHSSIKLPSLSLFYPTYNEAGTIEESVLQALRILPEVSHKYEVIVVNDGSTDATLAIASRLAKEHRGIVRVVSQKNKGYGGALKTGFKASRYDWIFFTDADMQFNLEEIHLLLRQTKKNQLVLGYRLKRAEGWRRQFLADCLKTWNRVLLNFPPDIKDVDCAFKLIHCEVIKSIGPLFSDGAMISTEIILKADRAKYTHAQVGVTHFNRTQGTATGSDVVVVFQAVRDTFALRTLFFQKDIKRSFANLYSLFV